MRMNRMSRTGRGVVAAAFALLACGAIPQAAGQGRSSKCVGPLPAFADAARKGRSVIFSNAVYLAELSDGGRLNVTLLRNGKPAGESFSLYQPHFYGYRKTGGFSAEEYVDVSLKAGTQMPAAQPKGAVKFEATAVTKDRQFVELEFGGKSIVVNARFRPWTGSFVSRAAMGAFVPRVGAPQRERSAPLAPADLAAAEGMAVTLQPESGAPVSIRFSDEVRWRELPKVREYDVRGCWDGYVVRGRALSKGTTFYYYQYEGTMPAQGFSMRYTRSRDDPVARVEFEFEAAPGSE